MSLFEKLKTAIRGNPVFKEYELGKHVCSAGPGLLWRVYEGFKKSTRQDVSLFVFFKKVPTFEKMPKKERAAILDMLKKGPSHLVKLRHPQLLRIEHALVESSDCIAFVTEPVFCSLANALGDYENLPSPLPLSIKEYEFHPVEVKYGLLQLAEGLSFLHNGVRMLHGNLIPGNVIINRNGEWKLAGFNFCCFTQYATNAQTTFQFQEYDTGKPFLSQPNLDYLAPEYILEKNFSPQSDMYSMGMLIYAIYNQGRPLFENRNNLLSYKNNVEQVSRITNSSLGNVPEELKESIRAMLSPEPAVRIESLQMTKTTFFDDELITALHTLDKLCEETDIAKSKFFKTLHQAITKLPRRMMVQKVFPALTAEFHNHKMIPFVLPNVLMIAEESSIQEYATLVLPALEPVFAVQEPIQVPLILLQRMDLLLKKSSPTEVKSHLLPMILGSLNSNNHEVQELCVSILPSFAGSIDYTSLKHSIIPRIMSVCLETTYLAVKVKTLVSVGAMLEIFDKSIMLDQIMPRVFRMESNEPGVLMAILGICHGAVQKQRLGFNKDYLAIHVLPYLIPKSTQPTLNVSQFNKFITVIKEMLNKVQVDHQSFLEHDQEMQEQTRSTLQLARDVKEAKEVADVASSIEAMSNSTQEVSVSSRRGNTQHIQDQGAKNDIKPSNSDINWLSSWKSDDNTATSGIKPVSLSTQPNTHSSSLATGSLFAGLSVQANNAVETVPTPSQMPDNSGNTNVGSTFNIRPPATGGMLQPQPNHDQITSGPPLSSGSSSHNVNPQGILQPQPASQNQSMTQPPLSQAKPMGTLQPQPVSSYIHTQPISAGMLQPQPVPHNQPTSGSLLFGGSSRHPSFNSQYKPPDMMIPPEPPTDTSAGHLSSQSKPLNMLQPQSTISFPHNQPVSKPPMNAGGFSGTSSSMSTSNSIGMLQPQPLQSTVAPSTGYTPPMIGKSMPSITGPASRQVAPPSFRQDILQPTQSSEAQPLQPSSLSTPQMNFTTTRGVQHPQAVQPYISSGSSMGGAHTNAGLLVPERTSLVSTTTSPYTLGASVIGESGLTVPALIGVPQVPTPQQLSPGSNPFADINDLLG